jgi:hypothetical protein
MDDKNFKYLSQENFNPEALIGKYPKQQIDYNSKVTKSDSQLNLNERLNDAYSDLEKLKRAVEDIKTTKGNLQSNFERERLSGRVIMENEDFKRIQAQNPYTRSGEMRMRQIQTENIGDVRITKEDNFKMNMNNYKTPNRNESESRSNIPTPSLNKATSKRKTDEIINNFKDILKESEKYISDPPAVNYPTSQNERKYINTLSSMNINMNYDYNSPDLNASNQQMYSNPLSPERESENNFNSFVNKITSNNLKEEIDRLRISNQVLNKSNLDYKNQNKIMQYEIEVLQNSNLNNNYGMNSNFDHNVNNFIEGLKNSLNSCQMSNKELGDIIENLQKRNSDLISENNLLKEQFSIVKNELDALKKKFCELKVINENILNEKSKKENECNQLELRLKEKDEKANEDEEKISNLFLLIENYEKNKSDNLELQENLKNTLEVLKKSNAESEKEKANLSVKIEELQNENLQKNYDIDQLKNSIQSEFKEKDFTTKELKNLRDDISAKESYLKEIQLKFRNALMDIEKNKTKMETINLNIEEKDHVINNLKNSLNYYTKTFEEIKNELDNTKVKLEAEINEKVRIVQNFELCRKKLNDSQNLLNELKNGKEELQMKNLKLEKELIENRNKITQMEFENEVLSEKLSERDMIINKYKEENKVTKFNKISEDLSINYNRGNAENKIILKKQNELIDDMSRQIMLKDEMIHELLVQVEDFTSKKQKEVDASNYLKKEMESEIPSNMFVDEINFPKNIQSNEEHKFNLPLNTVLKNIKNEIIDENYVNYNDSGSDLLIPMHTINTPRLNELETITSNNPEVSNTIFAVNDGKRIVSYDFVKNRFDVIELVDSTRFEENFNKESVTSLNTVRGFFVITGMDSNLLFYYNHSDKSMKLFAELYSSHKSGGLVYNQKNNSLYSLSGNHVKNCEKLVLAKSKLEYIPEMTYDRSHASYVILNENYLYAFFGYSYLNASYLDTIERINLDSSDGVWEMVKYSFESNNVFSTSLKSFITIPKSEEDIYIFGGYDGKNRTNNKNLIKFNSSSSEMQYLPEIKSLFKLCLYDCTKENKAVSYSNEKGESLSAIFDDYFQLHLINNSNLDHQILDNSAKNI